MWLLSLESLRLQIHLFSAYCSQNQIMTLLIESASGVRVQFSSSSEIPQEIITKASRYAQEYLRLIIQATNTPSPLLILGYDGRPNGSTIGSIFAQVWSRGGARVAWLGRVTTPLLESAIRTLKAQGGAMITASHNPFDAQNGYWNGWKFCTPAKSCDLLPIAEGALLSPTVMKTLINQVQQSQENISLQKVSLGEFPQEFSPKTDSFPIPKAGSPKDFPVPGDEISQKVFYGYLSQVREELGLADNTEFGAFRTKLKNQPTSAKTLIFDGVGGGACGWNRAIAERFGFEVIEINQRPGEFLRPIEPIGAALVPAMSEVFVQRALLACCFDADADRGNVVGHSEVHPQYVAALNVVARLCAAVRAGEKKLAVVAHCAASPLIAEVAHLFGAKLEYVETGEINVVSKMRAFSAGGYVAIGVEAYNGGTVFPGSRCRDGLLTALSTASVLADKDILRFLMDKLGTQTIPQDLPGLVALLPRYLHFQGNIKFGGEYSSISDTEIRIARGFSRDRLATLKEAIDRVVAQESTWPGFSFVTVRNMLGGEQIEGVEAGAAARIRTGNFSGGYRIELMDDYRRPVVIWFRPSQTGTEFRFGIYARVIESVRKAQNAFVTLLEQSL